jgi:hypothetical protein
MDKTVRPLRRARFREFRSASALAAKMRSAAPKDVLDAVDLACIARAVRRRVKRVKPPESSDA